jgi:tetratricopeptide (TPR) repeat protein
MHLASLQAQLARSGGNYSASRELLEAARSLADEGEVEPAILASLLAQLGATYALMGAAAAALPHLERAVQIAEEQGLDEIFVRTLISRGILAQRLGRIREAELLLSGAAEYADRLGLVDAWLRADNNLAVLYEMTDRFALSLERGQEAVRRCRRIGDRVWEAMNLTGELLPMVLLGRWDDAITRFAESEELGHAGGVMTETMLLDVVEVLCARDEVDAAEALVSRFAAGEASDDPQARVTYFVARAHVLLARGALEGARVAADAALESARLVGPMSTNFKLALEKRVDVAVAAGETAALQPLLDEVDALPPGHRTAWLRAIRARMAAHLGDPGGLEAAETILRDLDMRFRLAVALLEDYEKTGDETRRSEARELFEELGAVAWLARIAPPALVPTS